MKEKLENLINNLFLETNKNENLRLKIIDDIYKNHKNSPIAHNMIGISHIQNFNNNLAKKSFQKSIDLEPTFIPALLNLAEILKDEKNFSKQIALLKKVVKIDNRNEKALVEIGKAYKNLYQYEKSIPFFKKSIQINKKNSNTYYSLGLSYLRLGLFQEAYECFLNYCELNGFTGMALFYAYDCADYLKKNKESYIKNFISILNNPKLSKYHNDSLSRLALHYDSLSNYNESLKYFKLLDLAKAKIKIKRQVPEVKDISELTKKIYKIDISNKISENSYQPIFIISLPRSGSTLLEQILSNHSQVNGLGELDVFLEDGLKMLNYDSKINLDSLISFRNRSLKKINKNFNVNDKKFFIDKNPFNIEILPLLIHAFPKGKFIYLKRDDRDTIWSIFINIFRDPALNFSLNESTNYVNKHKLLINYYIKIYLGKIFVIDYENIVNSPKKYIPLVLNYLNLDFEELCLKPELNNNSIRTLSQFQARNPIIKSKQKWKPYKDFLKKYLDKLV